jgi:hypothetical protein
LTLAEGQQCRPIFSKGKSIADVMRSIFPMLIYAKKQKLLGLYNKTAKL